MKNKLILPIMIVITLTNCESIGIKSNNVQSGYPRKLSEKVDTIEVKYMAWACACANWLPDKYFDLDTNKLSENPEDYCIFIEAETKELKIPPAYHLGGLGEYENRIKLIGRYYSERGTSRDYEKSTSEKPKPAKVFRYSKIEVIKPYLIWDFESQDDDIKTMTIENGMKAFYE